MKKYLRLIIAILLLCGLFASICVQAGERINPVFSTNQAPQLIVGDVTGAISACEGMASVSPAVQQFTVSASGLSADVAVTAPGNFEISLAANGTYSNSLMLAQISGLISSVTVYVRSSAQATAGNITGDVTLTSGAVSQTAKVTGHITALPIVNAIADQTKQNGQLTDAVAFSGTANTYTWTNDNPAIGLPASGTGNIDKFTAINTGTIPITAHITVTPVPASYMYATNSALNSIFLINTVTNKVEQTITEETNSNPVQMVFSPDKSLLYVTNQSSGTVSVINTSTNKIIATFPAGFNTTGIAISPDGSRLYVTDFSFSHLNIINTANYAIIKTVDTGINPYSMVISADGKYLYIISGTSNLLQFYNTTGNFFEYGIVTGVGPNSIVISPDNKTLYIANYNSHDIAVVDIASRRVTYKIDVVSAADWVAISPDGSRLYVSNIDEDRVTVINTATRRIITTIDVGDHPVGVTVNSDGSKVYVSNIVSNYISVIDATTNKVTGQIQTRQSGYFMAILSDNACRGQPVTFSITVNPSPVIVPPVEGEAVIIPNSFSPNGDGANDTWVIKNLSTYPHNTVEIFNRYGQRLFLSNGYGVAWDGTVKGEQLPPGTYYYIVNLKNGSKSLSGSVTIIR
ncbi:gliding motility-associated C-terminal domain-containing protein [Mucilaginibacter pineti]|uniref:Gliding motility-associated C-terminal domain-containing protein n=1 Tax=Mucilaginibacter pineti TaxID=1391627 RepID=A0A1G7ALF5_9SPHI|nr:gliding motility-associated C-terminal domain-containing protein [Mucilaginibacter pineti]SDE15679.1 gliding motility-associated C-terminal domain-containing protein [Mucilaginibacter pineti]